MFNRDEGSSTDDGSGGVIVSSGRICEWTYCISSLVVIIVKTHTRPIVRQSQLSIITFYPFI